MQVLNNNEKVQESISQNKNTPQQNQDQEDIQLSKSLFKNFQYIDRGQTGKIYKAQLKETNDIVILKYINKCDIIKNKLYLDFQREVEIHSHIDHKHIIKVLGSFQDDEIFYIIQEYAPLGNLQNYLQRYDGDLSEQRVAKYTLQLLNAIEYLQIRNIIHRDIKLENIVVVKDDLIKLTDFGSAVHTINKKRKSFVGTYPCLSPEMILKKEYDNTVDIWALGILVYELLFKKNPFYDKKLQNQEKLCKQNIVNIKIPYDNPNQREISDECKDFINQILQKDPSKRLTIQEAMQHKFIVSNINKQNQSNFVQNNQLSTNQNSNGTQFYTVNNTPIPNKINNENNNDVNSFVTNSNQQNSNNQEDQIQQNNNNNNLLSEKIKNQDNNKSSNMQILE